MSVKFPWVKWHAAVWLASETRLNMSTSQRSIYLDLLFHTYESGDLPDSPNTLALLACVTPEEFNAAWPVISAKFEPHPTKQGRLVNARAIAELSRRDADSENGKRGGVKSGESRRSKGGLKPHAEASPRSHALKQEQEESKTRLDKDQEQDQNTLSPSARVRLDEFVSLYPKPGKVQSTTRAYAECIATDAAHAALMAGLKRWLATSQWQEAIECDSARWVPDAARFIRDELYLESPMEGE